MESYQLSSRALEGHRRINWGKGRDSCGNKLEVRGEPEKATGDKKVIGALASLAQ